MRLIHKHWMGACALAVAAVTAAGCATARRDTQTQTSFADAQRMARLEAELQGKNEMVHALEAEVQQLRGQQTDVSAEPAASPASAKSYRVVRSSLGVSVQSIQKALKRAGYYSGSVNGAADLATKRAVEAFQRAGGLAVDGVVGPKTWAKLQRFANS